MATSDDRLRLSALRRRMGARSLRAFCRTYLPNAFPMAFSPMHEDLFQRLMVGTIGSPPAKDIGVGIENGSEVGFGRGLRLAVAAPRGHAKSTICSNAFILWCLCYGLEQHILLISNTLDQAIEHLTFVKNELASNPLIASDFPEVAETGARPGPPRWRRSEIITRSGAKITALGVETKIRGRKHREHRPTLIVLDDVENETEVRSADQRERKWNWLQKAVLKAGSAATNVVVVGTVLHYDSMLQRLLDPAKSPGWTARKYKAVTSWAEETALWQRWEDILTSRESYQDRTGEPAADAFLADHADAMARGTGVLWPERDPYPALMKMRVREGRASFDSEKQNEPVDPDQGYFRESDLRFWDDEFGSEEALLLSMGSSAVFYGACDPSLGKRGSKGGGRGDDTAIMTIVRHSVTGVMYLLDADIRPRKPDAIIQDVITFERRRHYSTFAFEENHFQHFVKTELERRSAEQGVPVPVKGVTHTTDKLGRIQRLQPLLTSGTLRLSRRHTVLLDQLRQFPMAAHDDGPDALEMCVKAAEQPKFWFEVIHFGKSRSVGGADVEIDENGCAWTVLGSTGWPG